MENQHQSSVCTSATINENQDAVISQVTSCQGSRRPFGTLLPEVWLMISKELHSTWDIFQLSRVNRSFFSLLIPERATLEAEKAKGIPVDKNPSMLFLAIKRGWALSEIEKIIGAYQKSKSDLLQGHGSMLFEPPLHLAVRLNRLDVVDKLLESGCWRNLRWGGQWDGCAFWAHEICDVETARCMNALCVAREVGNDEMVSSLLSRGIEDLGRHRSVLTGNWWNPGNMLNMKMLYSGTGESHIIGTLWFTFSVSC
ncbi:hypothetical protein HD806DRAFT_539217 [Xylariaceae sp. AK1471]|nr:hypothetical protein HD806DRAFT_539217 [Xylariaceae sp. AK1471]